MSKGRILIIGCGFPQLSLLRAARAHGLTILGVDMNPAAIGVPQCDEFVQISTRDVVGIAQAAKARRVSAITTTGSEVALKTTAAVAEILGLPFYADSETVRRCQEKDAMREGYEAAGVRVPPFRRCETLADAAAFVAEHGAPVVVKPALGWGQRGVSRVDDLGELAGAFESALTQSQAAGKSGVLVEAWIEGREYSVNGWIEGGVLASYCVTERLTVPGKRPLGVMIAEVYPAGLSPADEASVVAQARLGAAALGHRRGPCYSQLMFSPSRGASVLETAARNGGGFDADVTRLASGVDFYTRLLGVALGDASLEKEGARSRPHAAAIAKFLIGRPGVVKAVSGLERARSMAGVDDAQVFVPEGGRVLPLTDSAKRAGYVLCHASSRAAVLATADAALAAMVIDTTEDRLDPELSGA